jgi:hypothetical protein
VNTRRTAPQEEEVRPMQLGHRTTRCSPGRTENAVFTGLMGAFLAGSPFVAYAAGRWANAALSRQARLQGNALFQVPATLLGEAPLRTGSGTCAARGAPAQWRAPDGQLRTGPVSAPSGAAAGSMVTVWVNQAGDLADPPMRQPEIADRTELAQGLAAAGFAVALAAIGGLARKSLDKRAAA